MQLVNAGAIEDLTDVFNAYCSDKLAVCYESTNGISKDLSTFDGKMMAIPDISPGMDAVPIAYVRADWMKELGLDEPETFDDLVDIAQNFLKKNPGGNVTDGIAVSQEIIQEGGGIWHINGLFSSFGAYPKMWLEESDGSVVYGSLTNEVKDALIEIRKLVDNDIIDPSFAVRDGDQCLEMVSTGQVGIFFGAWWSNQWPIVSILETAQDSGVEWKGYIAPLSDSGKLNVAMKNPTSTFIVVKKGVADEVKKAVVKTINYQYDLDQGQAEGVRPNGMDSPFSWHYYPINVLHCDYDAKEKQIQADMDCINGLIEYDDMTGDGKTWYDGYTTVLEKGFSAAVEENISTANAWGMGNWRMDC